MQMIKIIKIRSKIRKTSEGEIQKTQKGMMTETWSKVHKKIILKDEKFRRKSQGITTSFKSYLVIKAKH